MNQLTVYVACTKSKSVDIFTLDEDTGALQEAGRFQAEHEVQYLGMDPTGQLLHAAVRSDPPSVLTLQRDSASGTLSAAGTGPLAAQMVYLEVDRTRRHLLAASYGESLVTVSGITDGIAAGPVTARQVPGWHAHTALFTPDNKFVYATSLGDDKVVWWPFNDTDGTLGEPASVDAEPGSGPRHLRFSAAGDRLYVIHEMGGQLTVYDRDPDTGALTQRQSLPAFAPELNLVPGKVRDGVGPAPRPDAIWCAELRLTPDGRFLYTTERSTSTVAAFAVDPGDGTLSYLGYWFTETQPRGMNIDPGGRFLLACGEVSNQVSVHRIDQSSGALSWLGRYDCGQAPRGIMFAG